MSAGFVYALRSDETPYIKIGRSRRLPPLRLAELNANNGYGGLGPWEIIDFIQVTDAVAAETFIHRSLRDRKVAEIKGAKELFSITAIEATEALSSCPDEIYAGAEKLARLRHDAGLQSLLRTVFDVTGLGLARAEEGRWTLSLYPSTSGGRLFTLNIGKHEVAYAVDPRGQDKIEFIFVTDRMYRANALSRLYRGIGQLAYKSASSRLQPNHFECSMAEMETKLRDPMMRRGLVAYWMDHLISLKLSGQASLHARHHNANAVREILSTARKATSSR